MKIYNEIFTKHMYRLILISAIQRMLFQKWSGFLDVFWQSLIWPCLHLVVNPLYLLWWSILLIVDFDSDLSTSCRVCFSWLDVVKRFFFTTERSTTLHNCGPPWISSPFYVAELSSAFFSQNVPNCWFGRSLCSYYLSNGVLFLMPNNRLFLLYGDILWLHDVGSE